MKFICFLLLLSVVASVALAQTQAPPPPQTARQALLEMFTGKKDDSFQKHLPDAALHTLVRKGSNPQTSVVAQFSMFARQAQLQGNHLETFDVGSLLLSVEQNGGREKLEVFVERDDLQGDEDQIELSFKYYENAELQVLPVVPRLIFSMQTEKEVWRLEKSRSRVNFLFPILTTLRASAIGRTNLWNQWQASASSASRKPSRTTRPKIPIAGTPVIWQICSAPRTRKAKADSSALS
jgi:hypothetical protein